MPADGASPPADFFECPHSKLLAEKGLLSPYSHVQGETVLTDEGRDFIRSKACEATGASVPPGSRFFDAGQP
jgi:hypothetical protein